ncbi:MAG: hypothetical protein NT060_01265, partial [Candidatus Omnitrophica bacterium]|nr:hypothetical protein [Candidatus Omnitrophota bacterium]
MSKRRYALQFIGLILFLAGIWYLSARFIKLNTGILEDSLKSFPLVYSCVIYIISYVVITFFVFLSKDVFWLAGAVIFGVKLSALLISISEVINAFILFHLSRKFGRAFVEKKTPEKYRYL